MHLPPGIAALLSSVELCAEAQAAARRMPGGQRSGPGHRDRGLGPEPYVQEGGRVFITGPYGGAPFGLEIVTPGDGRARSTWVCDGRSKLDVDPNNASVTIVSDPLPTSSGASRCS